MSDNATALSPKLAEILEKIDGLSILEAATAERITGINTERASPSEDRAAVDERAVIGAEVPNKPPGTAAAHYDGAIDVVGESGNLPIVYRYELIIGGRELDTAGIEDARAASVIEESAEARSGRSIGKEQRACRAATRTQVESGELIGADQGVRRNNQGRILADLETKTIAPDDARSLLHRDRRAAETVGNCQEVDGVGCGNGARAAHVGDELSRTEIVGDAHIIRRSGWEGSVPVTAAIPIERATGSI